jgi:hypothetical protein
MVMENITVPYLRKGIGSTPADGGCVMQIIDWITRGMWTDSPPSVLAEIRYGATRVNDVLHDTDRQALIDLIPRMMNTALPPTGASMEIRERLTTVFPKIPSTIAGLTKFLDRYDELVGTRKRTPVPDYSLVVEMMEASKIERQRLEEEWSRKLPVTVTGYAQRMGEMVEAMKALNDATLNGALTFQTWMDGGTNAPVFTIGKTSPTTYVSIGGTYDLTDAPGDVVNCPCIMVEGV